MLLALITAGCSGEKNTGQGQAEVTKPQPQVRVQAMPSATATLPLPVEVAAPSPEPSATFVPGEVYIEPTPDEDAIVNQIDTMMDEIDRKLKNEDFLLK